ncbi:MAG: thioredoxin family protein [Bacteroidales bacterium]|jgi:thioredoxin-related protein|nr:thioredoxin family protein [Bacteroidales bacterium]MBR6868621.1 thioredoxin family protein [Bacteroidales bacterium]
MKKFLALMLFFALLPVAAGAQDGMKKVYDEQVNQLTQIDQAVKQAKADGKYVICQVGGNWCPWCLRFADFITKDAEIAKLVKDNFVYIHVDYSPKSFKEDPARKERSEKMMKRLGNPGRFGYPVFVVLDGKGKVLHTQDSSFLEEGKGYSKDKVVRFFKNWTPKAVRGE